MKRQFDIKYIFQKMIMILLALGILTVGMTLSPNVHAADTGTSSNVSEPNPSNPDSSESGSTDPDTDNPSEPEPDEKLPQVILASSLTAHYDDAPFTLEASLTTGDGALSFTSSKPEVADVDESGLVTIHGIGKTSIKITAAETEQYLSATKTITLTVYATLIAPDNLSVTESARGNTLTWTPQTTCDGYYIYRKTAGESSWTQIGTVIGKTVRSWTDTTAPNGVLCQYRMTSYDKTASESDFSGPVTYVHLTRPSVTKVTRTSNKKMKVNWCSNAEANGYQIQYSPARLFTSLKTVTVSGTNTLSKTIGSLSKKYTYYARVRAYKTVNGRTYYSAWSLYRASGTAKSLSVSVQKKGSKTFELRAQAKQTMYQYDTVQGSCSDGTYGYFILYNRRVAKCKIAKVKLSTMKVVKVSGVLNVGHGNDMTYDSANKKLVIAHCKINPKRLSIVNPSTLQVEATKDITIPAKIDGATDAQRNAISGFCAITYDSSRRQYALLLSKSYNLLILNQNMEVVSYVTTTTKNPYVVQGMDSTDEYILIAQSPKYSSQKNIVSVYTWEGQYITKINVKKSYEIESIFHVGSKFYASFYRSYYKTYYTKEKKTVTKNGKKKKKTVKVAHRKLMRDNYIYKITNL